MTETTVKQKDFTFEKIETNQIKSKQKQNNHLFSNSHHHVQKLVVFIYVLYYI